MRNKIKDDHITCNGQNSPYNTTQITGSHMVEFCLEWIETIFLNRLQMVKCQSQQMYTLVTCLGSDWAYVYSMFS